MSARTVLGFDFGRKRIGVALGQTVTRTATGLDTLGTRDGRPDWGAITALIERWQPDALVVGLPLARDAGEQEMTRAARRFARQLEGRYHLPVELVDERYSSLEAESRLRAHTRGGAESDIDRMAAQIILQGWLDQQDPDA